MTPLMRAANAPVVRELVNGGADVSLKADGETSLQMAIREGRKDVEAALRSFGAKEHVKVPTSQYGRI